MASKLHEYGLCGDPCLTEGPAAAAARTVIDGLRVVHRRQAVDDLVRIAGAALRVLEATALSYSGWMEQLAGKGAAAGESGMGNKQLCATAADTALRDTGFHAGSMRRREG